MKTTKKTTKEVEKLAKAHWSYIAKLLENHGERDIDKIKFHYITAFIHGYKHCKEELDN